MSLVHLHIYRYLLTSDFRNNNISTLEKYAIGVFSFVILCTERADKSSY